MDDASFSTYYQLNGDKPVQFCLHIGDEWEDSFIAIDFENCIFTLKCESNQFQGERKNRSCLISLLYNSTFGNLKVEQIDEKQANGRLRQFVEDMLTK